MCAGDTSLVERHLLVLYDAPSSEADRMVRGVYHTSSSSLFKYSNCPRVILVATINNEVAYCDVVYCAAIIDVITFPGAGTNALSVTDM